MTTTSATDSVFDRYALQSSNSDSNKSVNEMNQADFLTLMTEQMKNQDPFEPADNGEFMSQMAQFSQVSAIENLSKSFEEFASNMAASQTLQATGLIGRSVMVSGSSVDLKEGGSVSASLDMSAPAHDVMVNITDASGALIDQVNLGSVDSGIREFTWDGTDTDGEAVPAGTYFIKAEGVSTSGEGTAISTLVPNQVSSVSINGNNVILNTSDGDEVSLSNVRHIM